MVTGICILSTISLRNEPDSKSEIVSQLLFGETFSLIEQTKNWTKIISTDDQYTGWISTKQLAILQTPFLRKEIATGYPFNTAISNQGNILIPAGGTIPNLKEKTFTINETVYTLKDKNATYSFENLAKLAEQYINVPYFWGGRNPFGIDCSGFTQSVYKQCGIQLNRDAYQQAEQGILVTFLDEIKCGDLAFFDNDEGTIVHVGLMLDKNKIIHASGKVRIDSLDNFGIMNLEENQYSHKLRIIKRIIS
jgi:gamma-D-glutamyl-L-lysine dipeptidyl-peptidase